MSSSTLSTSYTAATSTQASVVPLTTTFTPPARCVTQHFTQLSSPGYQIWMNEPVPVPGSTFSACYPSQWIAAYTSTSSSSIVPLMSPLVCPEYWSTVGSYRNDYIACCPSGFDLAVPTVTVDTDRPAYGGTCYSNFVSGTTITVTAYDSFEVTAEVQWVASTSADQAYAHPIDGIAAAAVITTGASQSTTDASTITSAGSSSSPSSSSPSSSAAASSSTITPVSQTSSTHTSLSGGQIAGAVIGSLAGLATLISAVLYYLHRRSTKEKKKKAVAVACGGGGPGEHEYKPEETLPMRPAEAAPNELGDSGKVEMGEGLHAVELDAGHAPSKAGAWGYYHPVGPSELDGRGRKG